MKSYKTSSVTICLSMASLMSSTTLISGLCAVTSSEASGKDRVIGERIGGGELVKNEGLRLMQVKKRRKSRWGDWLKREKPRERKGEQKQKTFN